MSNASKLWSRGDKQRDKVGPTSCLQAFAKRPATRHIHHRHDKPFRMRIFFQHLLRFFDGAITLAPSHVLIGLIIQPVLEVRKLLGRLANSGGVGVRSAAGWRRSKEHGPVAADRPGLRLSRQDSSTESRLA